MRIAHGERPQHVGVEDGEDDGDEAERDGERDDRRGQERGAAPQSAPRVAHVLRELFEPDPAAARFVEPLPRHQHAPERPPRRIAGVGGVQALGDQAIGFELEMRVDLAFEVRIVPSVFGRHTTQV